jgi:tRNA-specific adenosine deaminase 1
MELTMAAQDDATPWSLPTPLETVPDRLSTSPSPSPSTLLPGRAYFSALGIVRRKPSRPDAPTTLSKSCSDKLSLKQCTSLLSSVTSLLISPENAYLQTLVLPQFQYSARGCGRAFGDGDGDGDSGGGNPPGRMRNVSGQTWEGTGYRFHPFAVLSTSREFSFSRRSHHPPSAPPHPPYPTPNLVPSNLSTAWTAAPTSAPTGIEESLIGGVLQGRKAFPSSPSPSPPSLPAPRPLDLRGVSLLSRKKTCHLAATIAAAQFMTSGSQSVGVGTQRPGPGPRPAIARALGSGTAAYTYRDVKQNELLRSRRCVKDEVKQLCLMGWVRNDVRGEEFTIADM